MTTRLLRFSVALGLRVSLVVGLGLGLWTTARAQEAADVLGPGSSSTGNVVVMTWEELLDEVFGPIPVRDTVITGVDAEGLARTLPMPPGAVLVLRYATPSGVNYVYRADAPNLRPQGPAPLSLTVGAFPDVATASSVLAYTVRRRPLGAPLGTDIADRVFVGEGATVLQLNNVVVGLSLNPEPSTKEMLNIAASIAHELESGERFVTRATEMQLPEIVSVGLPERVRLGHEVTGSIVLTDIDPAKALLGDDTPLACVYPGEEPTITFGAPIFPEEAGEQVFRLVLGTPTNVVVTREIHIMVEATEGGGEVSAP